MNAKEILIEFRASFSKWRKLNRLGLAEKGIVAHSIANVNIFIRANSRIKQMEKEGLFLSTNLETFGACNRKCSFCFNHERFEKRKLGVLEEAVWTKIIDELASLNFAGRISPYFYGEPFLDKRLMRLMAYARKKCPLARIRVNTNGDYLDEATVRNAISAGVDTILITNYDDIEKPILEELATKYSPWVKYRAYTEFRIQNRSGDLFEESNDIRFEPCNRPSSQLVVNWQGEVALCCNDFYAQHNIGNVKNKSIAEMWYGDVLKNFRNILEKKGGRQKIEFCNGCDMDNL